MSQIYMTLLENYEKFILLHIRITKIVQCMNLDW